VLNKRNLPIASEPILPILIHLRSISFESLTSA